MEVQTDLVRRRHRDPPARGRGERSTASRRCCSPTPDEVEDLVVGQVANSALFASRFRENAARALLLPRRRPGTRTPLWQQRQRAADLLAVASRYGSFPILVETYRECLSDVFDLDALREILGGVAQPRDRGPRRRDAEGEPVREQPAVRLRRGLHVRRRRAAGRATRRRADARPRPAARAARAGGAARAARSRRAGRPRAVAPGADRRAPGDDASTRRTTCCAGSATCRRDEVAARVVEDGAAVADAWLAELAASRRAVRTRIAGEDRWIAIEDVARYRDGVGVTPPVGVPEAFLGAGRPARSTGCSPGAPGPTARSSPPSRPRRWGLPVGIVEDALERLLGAGTLAARRVPAGRRRTRVVRPGRAAAAPPSVAGAAPSRGRAGRSGRAGAASCRPGTAIAPVAAPARTRAVPWLRRRWSGSPRSSTSSPASPIPASVLERDVLPARIPGYQPRLLDELGAMGEVALGGAGEPRPRRRADRALPPGPRRPAARSGAPDGTDARPAGRGTTRSASTSRRAAPASTASSTRRPAAAPDREMLDALWDLVWAGEVTNDTFAPLRALRWKRPAGSRRTARAGRAAGRLTALGPPEAAGRWSLVEPAASAASHAATERLPRARRCAAARAARRADPRGGRRGRASRAGSPRVYPVLRALEEAGRIRRGYFVDGLGRRSSRSPARSTGCARCANRRRRDGGTRRPPARRRRPGQPVRRRARRGRAAATTTAGRSSEPPGRMSCSSTGSRRCTSSAAARRSRRCPPPTTRRSPVAALGRPRAPGRRRTRSRELVIRKVDGEAVATSPRVRPPARGRLRARAIAG